MNPIGPRGVYDEAKRYAEAMVMAYRKVHDLDTQIVRIFNTYGPRMRLDDGRVVPNFIRLAREGQPLTLYGDGSQTRSFAYVADTVAQILALSQMSLDGPVNVGSDTEHSVSELAQVVEQVVGHKLTRSYLPLPVDDPVQRRPDLSRLRALLGDVPSTTLSEGLQRTWASFQPAP